MIEKHKILIGDCVEEMKKLDPNSVDIIITSPPYNLKKPYNSYDDNKPRTEYLIWLDVIAVQMERVLKENGSLFINIGGTNIDPWLSFDVGNVFRKYFILQNHIVWAKSISIDQDTHGHFKPINSKRFLNYNHENIFHFTKSGNEEIDRLSIGVEFMDKTNIKRRNHAQDKRCAGNLWYIPYETVQSKKDKYNHPAGFPLKLPMNCIKMTGKTNAIVLDPFAGTGSTIIAAHLLNHTGIAMEIDQVYADTILQRLMIYEHGSPEE